MVDQMIMTDEEYFYHLENIENIDNEDYFQFDFDEDDDNEYIDEFGVTIYHLPNYSGIPPTSQELADWAAFNRELDLTLIPDWERERDWM